MSNRFNDKKRNSPKLSIWTGLPFKMVWISALAGLVISILITAIQLTGEIQAERDYHELNVKRLMNALAGAAADAAFQVDTEKAELVVTGIFEFPTVSHVEITTDITGTLLQKSTNAAAEEPRPLAIFLFGEHSQYELPLTIPGRAAPVGSLIVRLDLNLIADYFVADAKEELFDIFFGVMIFSGLLSILFYFLLAKPLINASVEMRKWLDDSDGGDGDITISIPKFHDNDELGELLHSVESVIAARKALDIKLRHQQRALNEHAIVSITDVSGKIVDVNDKFVKISGYSKEELLGKTHRIVKSGEHSPEFYEDLWNTISSGEPWSGEVRNLKKNLESYWVKATIYPFKDEKGNIVEYISMRTDITDLKRKEAEISQFKSTLGFMKDEIYMFWTDTLQIFYVNQAALNRTGLREDEIYYLTPVDINQGLEKKFLHDKLQALIEGEDNEVSYQSIQYRSDGTLIPTETFIELIKPEGEKPRFVAITSDISERLEIDKAKTEFVSTVSHELRTPLTSIKGALGLVRAGALGKIPDKAKKILDTAYKNTDRLTNLINDILDIEKAEAGMLSLEIEPLDIAALIVDAIEINKGYGDEYGIKFAASGIDKPVMVQGDDQRLMQVITNLMSNAAKFSNHGEDVKIALTKNGKLVRVSVIDFGCGIPVAAQSSIFDKFTQADSSDQRQQGGTGLGLSIAKSIINGLGGNIGFTSKVGKGTTFYFDLRASVVEKQRPAA